MPAVKLTFVTLPSPPLLSDCFIFLYIYIVFFCFHMNQAELFFQLHFILTNLVSCFSSFEFRSSLHLSVSSFTHCQSWHSLPLLPRLSSLISNCLRCLLVSCLPHYADFRCSSLCCDNSLVESKNFNLF